MTVELKFLGKQLKVYNGSDAGVALSLQAGDGIALSDEKTARLLADFPHEFQKTSGARADIPEDKPAKVAEPETVLERSQRAEKPTGKQPMKNKEITPKRNKSFVPKNRRK